MSETRVETLSLGLLPHKKSMPVAPSGAYQMLSDLIWAMATAWLGLPEVPEKRASRPKGLVKAPPAPKQQKLQLEVWVGAGRQQKTSEGSQQTSDWHHGKPLYGRFGTVCSRHPRTACLTILPTKPEMHYCAPRPRIRTRQKCSCLGWVPWTRHGPFQSHDSRRFRCIPLSSMTRAICRKHSGLNIYGTSLN